MTNRGRIFVAVSGLALLAWGGVALAQGSAVTAAIAAGQVGERADGYLGVRGSIDGGTRAAVEQINIKRRALYTSRASERGVAVEVGEDSLIVHGRGGSPQGGAEIDAQHDHRIAMSFLVLGTLARAPVTVTGAETIETSFPGFAALMNRLGARIEMLEP